MPNYHKLDANIERQIAENNKNGISSPYKFCDEDAVRRRSDRDPNTVLRPSFVRDIEKILHLPLYNRYNDKTQVFSFYRNDDITRRGLHVQLVSRISRNIGRMLGLNLDLIEAIALGHDVGHTPFGHAGERMLSELLFSNTGRYFNHNVHSTRVLDVLNRRNVSLQTLDGILCHNGELELKEYRPVRGLTFERYDKNVEDCYTEGGTAIKKLVSSTLEGCVVRISDIIAYIGKDRQDAVTAKILSDGSVFKTDYIGKKNAEMINNLTVDIVNHSFGKDCIVMSDEAFNDMQTAKEENYKFIYQNEKTEAEYNKTVRPMMEKMYNKLLDDLKEHNAGSPIFLHHVNSISENCRYYENWDYSSEDPDQIVADYIASMTDDYFIDLYSFLFPNSTEKIEFHSYFEDLL